MPRRRHLRTRVLLLTGAFSLALFTITFGLSWRAKRSQERWSRIIEFEIEAIARLEEVIRAQNAFRMRFALSPKSWERYRIVAQLVQSDALSGIGAIQVRARVRAFEEVIREPNPRPEDIDATSVAIVTEAQRVIEARKREIARQIPALERDADDMMSSGLAIAWIVVLVSFAVAQTTLRKVVRPLEELSVAADRITTGDLAARAPVAGDHEVAHLGVAFNRMTDELKARARTDDLTGLPNFRAFRERIDTEIDRFARYPSCFGILVLDLDRFKQYNDRFGHLAGNDALRRVASAIHDAVRAVDFAARYGGEEFAVIAPEVTPGALTNIAERVRAAVESLPAPEGDTVTVSIGGALFPEDAGSAEALFRIADERLYEAKRRGRNCVVVAGVNAPVARSAD